MKAVIIGYGNVGKEVEKALIEHNVIIHSIIKRNDTLDINSLDSETFLFICVPSKEKGEAISHYYTHAFEKGAKVITCEKAFLAHNWELVQHHKTQIRYSATVGGDSGILKAVSNYFGKIKEIKAVVNGTLNYVGERLSQGVDEKEVYEEVIAKGFAEPGSKNLEEVIVAELKDVLYKTVILANYSGLYDRVVEPEEVQVRSQDLHLRCSVFLNKDEIKLGFFEQEDMSWFPRGVNNIIYINGKKSAEGPGAGGRITAERMFKDFQDLIAHRVIGNG